MDRRIRFEALYQAHSGAVRAFARRRVSAAAADDVVADVFLTAWRRLDEVPDEAVPWLLGVARGVVSNTRRAEARRLALVDRLVSHELVTAGPSPVLVNFESAVLRALGALGERDQELLLLVAWDGLEREQAAKVLGVRAGAFAVRLHRARRRFARALAAEDTLERGAGERSAMEVSS